jgi:hypothetical protein
LLLMLLLALGVAARETPELLELTEDMSNEGMAVGNEDRLPGMPCRDFYPQEPLPRVLARPCPALNLSQRHCWFGPSHDASPKAGRDILQFLSIERK